MPRGKITTRPERPVKTTRAAAATSAPTTTEGDVTLADAIAANPNVSKNLLRALLALATAYLILWTLLGLFFSVLLIQSARRGAFDNLFNEPAKPAEEQAEAGQPQTEVALPGIGKVNIQCVQSSLARESIEKVINARSVEALQGEERTKFETCITEREAPGATPAAPATAAPAPGQ